MKSKLCYGLTQGMTQFFQSINYWQYDYHSKSLSLTNFLKHISSLNYVTHRRKVDVFLKHILILVILVSFKRPLSHKRFKMNVKFKLHYALTQG